MLQWNRTPCASAHGCNSCAGCSNPYVMSGVADGGTGVFPASGAVPICMGSRTYTVFIIPASSTLRSYTVETCGLTTSDTVLDVTTGGVRQVSDTACNSNLATWVTLNDDGCSTQSITSLFTVAAGTVTYVKLIQFNNNCGGSSQVRLKGRLAAGPSWHMRLEGSSDADERGALP
jgi:hypothetical protein